MSSPVAPPPAASRVAGFLVVGLQLALVLVVVHLFEVAERNHFFPVLCLAAGGFAVHAWLPPRWRAPFFCLLSLAGILFVLGGPDGVLVIGIGGGLIAACHLPVPFAARAGLVALIGLVLALLRLETDGPFWPVLGSMFMFRLIVYLVEHRRPTGPAALALRVAYFFPLPNVSFLFFPILDFKTFRDTYRADADWRAAQAGVGWIVRGLVHLVAYRVVKYYVLPDAHRMGDVPHLALFLAASYALYLHVSGYFHVITGLFHLFGFGLPRTHDNYFLASSFTDVWRRINIYWKDFMARVVFVPAFFGLRAWGTRPAAAAATLLVFLVTWLFHSYQVFWIAGAVPLSLEDGALWLGLGVLVAVNLQLDLARAARLGPRGPRSWGRAVGLSLRVVGMFVLICLFWASWNTPTVFRNLRAVGTTDPDAPAGVALVLGVLLAAAAVGVVAQRVRDRLTRDGRLPVRVAPLGAAALHVAVLGGLALAGVPGLVERLGPRAAGVATNLRRESVTPAEAAQMAQGYYEEIADARVPAGAWLAALEGRPRPPSSVTYTDMSRPVDDLLERELIPGWTGEVGGARLTVNRLGMRDQADRTREKPPGTCRLAFVGSSVVMGWGVEDDQVFTRLLEDRLNAARPPGRPRFEALNFGTGSSFVVQRHVLIDRNVFGFGPDAIYYVAHQDELVGPVRHLARLVANKVPLPYPSLTEVVRNAGITPDTSWGLTEALLAPHAAEIVSGVYRHLVGECRRRGVLPVWVYLPIPGVVQDDGRSGELARLAADAGFVVVDLGEWAAGFRDADVRVGQADPHANAQGHRLIADRLMEVMRQRPEVLPDVAR
jgi:hypothetical protein